MSGISPFMDSVTALRALINNQYICIPLWYKHNGAKIILFKFDIMWLLVIFSDAHYKPNVLKILPKLVFDICTKYNPTAEELVELFTYETGKIPAKLLENIWHKQAYYPDETRRSFFLKSDDSMFKCYVSHGCRYTLDTEFISEDPDIAWGSVINSPLPYIGLNDILHTKYAIYYTEHACYGIQIDKYIRMFFLPKNSGYNINNRYTFRYTDGINDFSIPVKSFIINMKECNKSFLELVKITKNKKPLTELFNLPLKLCKSVRHEILSFIVLASMYAEPHYVPWNNTSLLLNKLLLPTYYSAKNHKDSLLYNLLC